MSRVLVILQKIFNRIFVSSFQGTTMFGRLIFIIRTNPYLCISVILLIVGFTIGIIKRIIRS